MVRDCLRHTRFVDWCRTMMTDSTGCGVFESDHEFCATCNSEKQMFETFIVWKLFLCNLDTSIASAGVSSLLAFCLLRIMCSTVFCCLWLLHWLISIWSCMHPKEEGGLKCKQSVLGSLSTVQLARQINPISEWHYYVLVLHIQA